HDRKKCWPEPDRGLVRCRRPLIQPPHRTARPATVRLAGNPHPRRPARCHLSENQRQTEEPPLALAHRRHESRVTSQPRRTSATASAYQSPCPFRPPSNAGACSINSSSNVLVKYWIVPRAI